MRTAVRFVALALLLVIAPNALAAQSVRIIVHAPADTPREASIYLAGSLPSVGGFKPDGVILTRQTDGSYAADLELDPGQMLEFKITRGSWATVEKNAEGSERPNRILAVAPETREVEITVERWANGPPVGPPPPTTVVGALRLHTFDSRALKQPRTIRVWLPPGYDAEPDRRYAVLYMHDGQNCFDRATSAFGNEWQIDESLTRLIRDKQIPPLIVVGIDNGLANRINEYSYDADAQRGGGQAAAYAKFLLTEVMPLVDKTYRTQPGPEHTFLGGSSLGGIVSLEIARRHPGKFGGVIAMSPALQWAGQSLTAKIERDPGGLAGARIWIDMGTRENLPNPAATSDADRNQRLIDSAHRLDAALTKHGVERRLTIDDQHAEHNEPAWASRFPQAVRYVLHAGE